MLSAVCKTTF